MIHINCTMKKKLIKICKKDSLLKVLLLCIYSCLLLECMNFHELFCCGLNGVRKVHREKKMLVLVTPKVNLLPGRSRNATLIITVHLINHRNENILAMNIWYMYLTHNPTLHDFPFFYFYKMKMFNDNRRCDT